MKISLFSNYLNAHQLPLAMALSEIADAEFTFVSLMETNGVVGRRSLDLEYPFVLREYVGERQRVVAMKHALEDDLVIFGDMAGKEKYVHARADTGRLLFRCAERLLKRGDWWRFVPPKRYRTWNCFTRYRTSNMYVLCASAYTARDLVLFGFPAENCLKWGYFPDVEPFDCHVYARAGQSISICSVQRLIALKRVDQQIRVAELLKRDGYCFHMSIVGGGPERNHLELLAQRLAVDDVVSFLGELSPGEVKKVMRLSDVFLATSNRKEGWGATVNEAMAAGCCVVASDQLGSSPYLIEDGVSGLLYHGSDIDDLNKKMQWIISNVELISMMGSRAVEVVETTWSASEAAKRLVAFYGNLMRGDFRPCEAGPVSPAEILPPLVCGRCS